MQVWTPFICYLKKKKKLCALNRFTYDLMFLMTYIYICVCVDLNITIDKVIEIPMCCLSD